MSPLIRFPTVLFVIALCVSTVTARAARFSHDDGFVTIRGRELIAPDGKILRLKGINLGGWLVPEGYMLGFSKAIAPWQIRQVFKELVGTEADNAFWRRWYDAFITRDDIRYIQSTGMNIVRVPFDYRLFTPEEYPNLWVGSGFELLDRIVKWSREAGLFVLLDMHAAPCGHNPWNVDYGYPFLYEDAACLSRTAEVWRRIARHYARDRTIIGYDLLSEPEPREGEHRQARLDHTYDKIAAAIREVDANHLLFLTSIQPDEPSNVFGKDELTHKLVYTFHLYWRKPTEESFSKQIQFAAKYNVPIFLGESGENTDDWVRAFTLALERNSVGWTFWTYKRMDAMASMRTFDKPAYWDEIVAYQETPSDPFSKSKKPRPSPEHVRAALEGLLQNASFEKTRENIGYIEALGMHPRSRIPRSGGVHPREKPSFLMSVPAPCRCASTWRKLDTPGFGFDLHPKLPERSQWRNRRDRSAKCRMRATRPFRRLAAAAGATPMSQLTSTGRCRDAWARRMSMSRSRNPASSLAEQAHFLQISLGRAMAMNGRPKQLHAHPTGCLHV